MSPVPFEQITTVLLDVGNTLTSIDFPWICAELEKMGVFCEAGVLQRAEAKARPVISEALAQADGTRDVDRRAAYLATVFGQLPAEILGPTWDVELLAQVLVPILFAEGNSVKLWSYILPGVPEALAVIKELGYKTGAVSNSDGTIARQLEIRGFADRFDVIIDSAVVGFEKPDPRIFGIALEQCGSMPKESLYVGDIYSVDILGARAAGLHAALLDPYGDWPDVDCETFADLPALVRGLSEATVNRLE